PASTPSVSEPPQAPQAGRPDKDAGAKNYRTVWRDKSAASPPPAPLPEREPRPQPKAGPMPTLAPEQAYGPGPRLKDLDAEIETECKEMMGGLSDEELYGKPAERGKKPAATPEPGRKKAKVLAIHKADVFMDVPGGRSQGVLSLLQFPEGPPAIGTEIDV